MTKTENRFTHGVIPTDPEGEWRNLQLLFSEAIECHERRELHPGAGRVGNHESQSAGHP
jgi:hypothetical protein